MSILHLEDAGLSQWHFEPSNAYSLFPFSLWDSIIELFLELKDEVNGQCCGGGVDLILDFQSQVLQKSPL